MENAFGLLKGKFRRVKALLAITDIKRASSMTTAACVIDKIYIKENDWLLDEIESDGAGVNDDLGLYEGNVDGHNKRHAIANYLAINI